MEERERECVKEREGGGEGGKVEVERREMKVFGKSEQKREEKRGGAQKKIKHKTNTRENSDRHRLANITDK